MQLDIVLKHIIIGFYFQNNSKVQFFKNIISFVAYRIYKLKMFCRFEKKNENYQNLRKYVKIYLIKDMHYITMFIKSSQ